MGAAVRKSNNSDGFIIGSAQGCVAAQSFLSLTGPSAASKKKVKLPLLRRNDNTAATECTATARNQSAHRAMISSRSSYVSYLSRPPATSMRSGVISRACRCGLFAGSSTSV